MQKHQTFVLMVKEKLFAVERKKDAYLIESLDLFQP